MLEIEMFINGQVFGGWQGVTISNSLEQVSGSFELGYTELFPGQTEKWKIRLGDSCTVKLMGETIINGYVDDVDISYDSQSHGLMVRGRDVTGDLVDCSYIESPNEWKNSKIESIISDICRPFGITVSTEIDTGKTVDDFRINEGDTAFEAIAKLCKQRSIIPISKGDKKLTLTRTGTINTGVSLIYGKNIFSANFTQSNKNRFSKYIVKGQNRGFDEKLLEDYTAPVGQSLDETITRYRPLVILSETQGNNATLQERARWESTTRAGKSRKFPCVVLGWKKKLNGGIWKINELVKIIDSLSGLDVSWLITGLRFSLTNNGGQRTDMTLMAPVAFQQIAADKETKTAASKWESLKLFE